MDTYGLPVLVHSDSAFKHACLPLYRNLESDRRTRFGSLLSSGTPYMILEICFATLGAVQLCESVIAAYQDHGGIEQPRAWKLA